MYDTTSPWVTPPGGRGPDRPASGSLAKGPRESNDTEIIGQAESAAAIQAAPSTEPLPPAETSEKFMAKKRSRTAVLKRQREVRKTEKQQMKREKREVRGESEELGGAVATPDDLAGYGFPVEEEETEGSDSAAE